MCIGVGGCGWPNSSSVMRMILASFAFKNSAPSSASAAEAATNFNILHKEWIAPFNLIGCPSTGTEPKKKCPPARLRDLGAVRYDASEWMFKIISEA